MTYFHLPTLNPIVVKLLFVQLRNYETTVKAYLLFIDLLIVNSTHNKIQVSSISITYISRYKLQVGK